EPYTRAWFEELEHKRYARHGAWLPRMLEFSRHAQETLLMIGPGLGSDALQYQRHGTQITFAVTESDPVDELRRNYELRGLSPTLVPLQPGLWPFAPGQFDLAYVNALYNRTDWSTLAAQLYLALKPGGKVFVLAPAHYDVDFWQAYLLPWRRLYRPAGDPTSAPKLTARQLLQVFDQYNAPQLVRRHLRRAELPHLWRFAPLPLLERMIGRVMLLRAFKPLQSPRSLSVPAAA
ncbi:MAG: class I SAM-dependent methyltransferase, partial [Gemmataceae bacterium]